MQRALKVLIAEDEQYFIEFLKTKIEWQKYGMVVDSIAHNGKEALRQVQENMPNIALVDINMPLLNGLEFLTEAVKVNPGMKVIVVTGYSEFEYARQALKLGVFDYILKPFHPSELEACLLKMKTEINSREMLRDKQKRDEDLARIRQLQMLVNGNAEEENLESIAADYQLPVLNSTYLTACAIELDDYLEYWSDTKDKALLRFSTLNILTEMLSEKWPVSGFEYDENRIGLLIGIHDETETLREILGKVCTICGNHLHYRLAIGVGRSYAVTGKVRLSWLEALAAVNMVYRSAEQEITFYQDIAAKKMDIHVFSNIRKKPPYAIFLEQAENKILTRSEMMLSDIIRYMDESYGDHEMSLDTISGNFYISASYLRKIFKSGMNMTVMSVLQDIRMEHACGLLSDGVMRLADIAEAVGYGDPAYFSKTFKKKYGINPSEYTTICKKQK